MAGTTTDAPDDLAPADGEERSTAGPAVERRSRAESVVSYAIVAIAVLFTLFQLEPGLLLAATTPAGGDMGAHVWGPAYLRDTLLPSGRLAGWAPDWYAGFPAYTFYMVLPSLIVVALDVALPYGVAFKLTTVLGIVTLPIAAWALGRLARLPFPGPPLMAVTSVGFLFDRSFSIYGGNIASTLAGEFAFSISLSLAVVYLGFLLRGLETGRHRALTAVLFGLCALCHVIPAIFAVGATVVALLLRFSFDRFRWALTAGVVGGALTGFWTIPFVLRRSYLNDMGWERKPEVLEGLFPGRLGEWLSRSFGGAADAGVPGDLTLVTMMALVGVGASFAYRRRLGIFLTAVAAVTAVGYIVAPQGRLWNARLLPFWYLCLYLLAAIAVAELARAVATIVASDADRPRTTPRIVVAVLATAAGLVLVALPLRILPGGETSADGTYRWLGLTSQDRSYIPDWARWNYSGYERKPAYPEYQALIDTMAAVGADRGCGRAMWEYHPDLDTYGTPMAPMLLPYWTDGCIDSMEGLYFEASSTTPYHFINQSELSLQPSRAQRDMPYGPLDVQRGVEHLQMLGVRYYLTYTPEAAAQADAVADLTSVAAAGPWRVYEVADAPLVSSVDHLPAVMAGDVEGHESWLERSAAWYVDPAAWDVPLAATGPEAWERVDQGEAPERRPVPPVAVSDIASGDDWISFSVDEPGTPVVVKASYFPNWRVDGAEGPYRVTPNLMLVVPTETEVRLTYGSTWVEWLGWALTLAGVVGLVLLVRAGRAARRREATGAHLGDDGGTTRPPVQRPSSEDEVSTA